MEDRLFCLMVLERYESIMEGRHGNSLQAAWQKQDPRALFLKHMQKAEGKLEVTQVYTLKAHPRDALPLARLHPKLPKLHHQPGTKYSMP